MHFRLRVILTELPLELGESEILEFPYGGKRDIVVRLRTPSPQDQPREEQGAGNRQLIGEATSQSDVKADIHRLFEKLENGYSKGNAGALRQQLRPFEREVYGELSDHLRRTVNVLRWKMGYVEGPVDPLSVTGHAYSFDGQKWNDLPAYIVSATGRYGLPYRPKAPATVCKEVVELVSKKTEEPLGHQLLREAWSLMDVSPRSALVIGFAAGEVGFKQFLEQNGLPVPSESFPWYTVIKKRLSDRRLRARPSLSGRLVTPPEQNPKALPRCAELRNEVVHDGKIQLDVREIDRLLRAINDLLWILDLYSGYGWAMQHVSKWQDWLK